MTGKFVKGRWFELEVTPAIKPPELPFFGGGIEIIESEQVQPGKLIRLPHMPNLLFISLPYFKKGAYIEPLELLKKWIQRDDMI